MSLDENDSQLQSISFFVTKIKLLMPIRFWLIQLSAPIAGKRETFYAVVLPNGSIVEPTARRSVATVALTERDPIIPFLDPAATAAPNS
jgi:hypothetical protein